jgi:HK97 family phage major capsid protein
MNITELQDKRGRVWHEMKAVNDAAEGRALTAEEAQNWDRLNGELDALDGQITRAERVRDAERREYAENKPGDSEPSNSKRGRTYTAEQRQAFNRFLAGGVQALSDTERRDLQADSDTAGGTLIPDVQFVNELIKAVDDATVMRGICRVEPVMGADSLGVPTMSARAGDATWGTELQVATADTTLAFGGRELKPRDYTIYLKVSNKLLQKTAGGAERIVMDELAYKLAILEEAGFLTGSGGGNQPLGVFTSSAQGISTGRDVSTGNATTSIGADGLIEAKHSIKSNYWPRLRAIFHRDALKQIRKLKDGDGQYLWQAGLQAGLPDRILDVPYLLSEYAPNTFTSQLYVGIFGDFSRYWIADDMGMSIQRLNELLALTNQVGFIGRGRVDGMPVLEEAFARVKLA